MNMFIKQWPISAPILDHHQAMLVQKNWIHRQKLQIIKQQISSFASECIKTHAKNAG